MPVLAAASTFRPWHACLLSAHSCTVGLRYPALIPSDPLTHSLLSGPTLDILPKNRGKARRPSGAIRAFRRIEENRRDAGNAAGAAGGNHMKSTIVSVAAAAVLATTGSAAAIELVFAHGYPTTQPLSVTYDRFIPSVEESSDITLTVH